MPDAIPPSVTVAWRPASTYPELMAETEGWPMAHRRRLASGYELAEAMATGIERAHGQSLTAHLVRTASICIVHGGGAAVAVAAVAHAAYLLDRFTALDGARPRRALRRDEVRAAVGDDAEEIVHLYVESMPFDREIVRHLDASRGWDDEMRAAGLIHLANALDDHIGGAARWAGADEPLLTPTHGELARRLGHGDLAVALDDALAQHHARQVPDELRRGHTRGYVAVPIAEV